MEECMMEQEILETEYSFAAKYPSDMNIRMIRSLSERVFGIMPIVSLNKRNRNVTLTWSADIDVSDNKFSDFTKDIKEICRS